MKRLLMLMAALIAALMIVGTATAALLGIKGSYEGNRPDIDFDNIGVVNYNADTNLFTLTATDEKLVLPDGTVYWLSGNDYTTTLTLKIYVDESGNLTGGITGYDKMVAPVPPTLLLLGSGLLGFILFKRRNQLRSNDLG